MTAGPVTPSAHAGRAPRIGVTTYQEDASWRGALLGPAATVACYHQAVDALGAGVEATRWSGDGLVESPQLAEWAFAVGVQWHPEVRPELGIFEAFVAAAGRRQC